MAVTHSQLSVLRMVGEEAHSLLLAQWMMVEEEYER